jgi:hypothetical protein
MATRPLTVRDHSGAVPAVTALSSRGSIRRLRSSLQTSSRELRAGAAIPSATGAAESGQPSRTSSPATKPARLTRTSPRAGVLRAKRCQGARAASRAMISLALRNTTRPPTLRPVIAPGKLSVFTRPSNSVLTSICARSPAFAVVPSTTSVSAPSRSRSPWIFAALTRELSLATGVTVPFLSTCRTPKPPAS